MSARSHRSKESEKQDASSCPSQQEMRSVGAAAEKHRHLQERIDRLEMDAVQSTELLEHAQKEIDLERSRCAALKRQVNHPHTSVSQSLPPQWYLKIDDDATYGPVSIDDLYDWAVQGRISPDDLLSSDRRIWTPATQVPELRMEWITTLVNGAEFGPFNVFAIAELVADGAVSPKASVTHIVSGKQVSAAGLLSPEVAAAKDELDELRKTRGGHLNDSEATRGEVDTKEVVSDTASSPTPPKSVREHCRRHGNKTVASDQKD